MTYEKDARKRPALISSVPITIAVAIWLWREPPSVLQMFLESLSLSGSLYDVLNILTKLVFAFVLPTALYVFSDVCRQLGLLLQEMFYGRNGHRLPTTRMLMADSKHFSEQTKKSIREKINQRFGLSIPSIFNNSANEDTPQIIVDAVKRIVGVTRGDERLKDYNIKYGYCRNLLGGLLFTEILFIILLCVYYDAWILKILVVQTIYMFIMLCTFHKRAVQYADRLFNVFLNLPD